jgi:hypothetical protein
VPNVFINEKHVGGCDATVQAHLDGRLGELLSGVHYDYDLIVIGGGSGGLAASKVSDFFVQYYFMCVLFSLLLIRFLYVKFVALKWPPTGLLFTPR